MKKIFKTAFLNTIPVAAGYIAIGIGFGIIAQKNGFGIWWALAMSVFMYAGSMQYVGVTLLASGASVFATVLTTLLVNARHLFYGISLIDKYKNSGWKKPYLMFALTDETYSLICSSNIEDPEQAHWYYLFVSVLDHSYWITGGLLGVLIGQAITFNTSGVEFAMTALFITIFIDQWKEMKSHIPALAGLLSSLFCLILVGGQGFLIPSMMLIGGALLFLRPQIERKPEM